MSKQANHSGAQSGLGVRIRNALVAVAVLPLAAAGVAFVGFSLIEQEQARINDEVIPALLETRKLLDEVRTLTNVSAGLVEAQNDTEVDRLAAQIKQETKNIRSSTARLDTFALSASLVHGVSQSVTLIANNLTQQAQAVRRRLELQSTFDKDLTRMGATITSMTEVFDEMSLQASDRLIITGEILRNLLAVGGNQAHSLELLDSILEEDATRIEHLLEMRFRSRRLAQISEQLSLLTSSEALSEIKELVNQQLRAVARLTLAFDDGPQRQRAARSLGTLTAIWSGASSPYLQRIEIIAQNDATQRLVSENGQLLSSLEALASTVFEQSQAVSTSSRTTADATIRRTQISLLVLISLALVGSLLIGLHVIRRIAAPIDRITKATLRLAQGETDVTLPTGGDREIAELTSALAGFRDNSRLVQQQTTELQRSNEDLRQFAYVASHDLREPLRMVTSYLGLVKKRLGEQLDETTQRHMAYVVEGASRMDALVAGLLSYARLNRDNLEMNEVDLNALLSEVCQNLDAQITETAAKIEWRNLPVVIGDRIQLAQLLQNLIGNAMKFCRQDKPCVRVTAEANPTEWVFSITDNGIGIDPTGEKKLFDLFARGQDREQFEGTGIGLSVARKVVENHGGTIRIDQQFEGGTRMLFTLARDASEKMA